MSSHAIGEVWEAVPFAVLEVIAGVPRIWVINLESTADIIHAVTQIILEFNVATGEGNNSESFFVEWETIIVTNVVAPFVSSIVPVVGSVLLSVVELPEAGSIMVGI